MPTADLIPHQDRAEGHAAGAGAYAGPRGLVRAALCVGIGVAAGYAAALEGVVGCPAHCWRSLLGEIADGVLGFLRLVEAS